MSEFHFGVGRGEVDDSICAQVCKIAKKHGATFINPRLPEGWRYWFAGQNRGNPFDRALSDAVWSDLEKAGLVTEDGKLRITADDEDA